jgi:hypothetical protein
MPGVSRRGTVSGAHGVGKIQLKFKPVPPKRGHRLLGIVLYSTFFTLLLLSFTWAHPKLRYAVSLPVLRRIFAGGEWIKARGALTPAPSVRLIQAPTMSQAIFDQGYAHAVDRLMQMEIYRRASHGTLSAVYGNVTVGTDRFFRTAEFARLAQEDFNNLDDEMRSLLKSYSAGVNSYINEATFRKSLPLDFELLLWGSDNSTALEPWASTDSLAVLRLLTYSWSHGWEDQLRQELVSVASQVGRDKLYSRRPDLEGSADAEGKVALPALGGTVVAVSGRRSGSGSGLLASSVTSVVSGLFCGFTFHTCSLREFANFDTTTGRAAGTVVPQHTQRAWEAGGIRRIRARRTLRSDRPQPAHRVELRAGRALC